MRISRGAIYQALYIRGRGASRREQLSAVGLIQRCAWPRTRQQLVQVLYDDDIYISQGLREV